MNRALALICLLLAGPLGAQQNTIQPSGAMELAATHNAAMQAFNAGNYQAAAEGLEKVIALITDPLERAKIAPIFYTLGAAYFNARNYPKAVETFSNYVTQYPKAERVGEARLAIARATFMGKDYENAARRFAELEATPGLRDQALSAQAECYRQLKRPDEQIRILEKVIAPEIKTGAQAGAAVTLAELYLEKHLTDKVLALANTLHAKVALVDNVVALNSITVKLGDEFAQKKVYAPALAAYRIVRTREQVIAFQTARIAAMEKRMAENAERGHGSAQAYMAATQANEELKLQLEAARQLFEAFAKLPDYMPGVVFRMARVYYEWDKKWEAIAVFDRFLADYAEAREAESAMYSMIVCYADLMRIERTQKWCDEYLKKFPKGANAGTVGYLLGAMSLQANDPKKAVSFFGTMLERQPDSQFREQMRFLLGNAHFMQGEFAEARKHYQRFLKDFPKGALLEEAVYRQALTLIFEGRYEEALAAFNAYLAQYRNGSFAADAGYRVLVCKYSASLYDEVIAGARAWEKQFGKHEMAGEVQALLGDALAAESQTAEAAAAYTRAYQSATTDEVLNYALFEASKQLQKQGKWAEVAAMFEGFVQKNPDHPTVVAAMFWIGKAKARTGQTEEAKRFLVEQLGRYINEPKREAVEQLLQQLAQLCAKRPRPAAAPAPAPAPAPSPGASPSPAAATPPATPAPLPPYDAVAELKKQLEPIELDLKATGKARVLYAEAELLKLLKRPADAEKTYAEIAQRFEAAQLSPVLLAVVGEHLLQRGDREKAGAYFQDLREDFPKSDYLDYAFTGLGEIALAKKDYKTALEHFTRAADEIAGAKIKESTMGKARALLELGRYAEARKLFEQVAGIREWRGESTAAALFYLGEGELRQGHWSEAIAHYQRVFVAYQKYLPWAARAYLRAAESFDKLGKRKEAVAHLQEMLRNEKLRPLPECRQAEKMLGEWGAA